MKGNMATKTRKWKEHRARGAWTKRSCEWKKVKKEEQRP